MPDRRMLWKSVSQSRKVNSLSLSAALLWTWCIPWFDRDGYLEADADFLKYNVVPRRMEITEDSIPCLTKEIVEAGLWAFFLDEGGKAVVKETSFSDHQRLEYNKEMKSKWEGIKLLPSSPKVLCKPNLPLDDHSTRTRRPLDEDSEQPEITSESTYSTTTRRPLDEDSLQIKDKGKIKIKEREVKGKEEECEGKPNSEKPESISEEEKKQLAFFISLIQNHYKNGFNPILWVQNHMMMNPKTHLHVMRRIKEDWPEFPKAYADKISRMEDPMYNEKDHTAYSDKFKKEPVDISKILSGATK
jgi:hypothetical protein